MLQAGLRKSADFIASFAGGYPRIARLPANVHQRDPTLLIVIGYDIDAQLNDFVRRACGV